MNALLPILAVTVPFFALVLAGYVAGWRHLLPESAIPGLNAFVLYFALPCMLFRFGLNTPIGEALNPLVLAVYLTCALLMVLVAIAFSLDEVVGLKDASFGALAMTCCQGVVCRARQRSRSERSLDSR